MEEVDQAVAAAKRAFYKGIDGHKAWKDVPGAERKALLKKLAELMQRDLDIIAKLNSIDLGAPMMASKALTMGAIAKVKKTGKCASLSSEGERADVTNA